MRPFGRAYGVKNRAFTALNFTMKEVAVEVVKEVLEEVLKEVPVEVPVEVPTYV